MKRYLILAGMVIVFMTITACTSEPKKKKITYGAVDDATPATQSIIDAYNLSQETYEVEWVKLSGDNQKDFDHIKDSLAEGATTYDVLALNVTWIGDLADRGYIRELNAYMGTGLIEEGNYSPGIMKAGEYAGKQYALPYYQNIGLLYYRKDILQEMEASVLSSGNYRYSDIAKLAKRYKGEKGTDTGFVFQSNTYEGLTANVTEITNDLRDLRQGLVTLKGFVDGDYTPEDIMNYDENQTHDAFIQGKAVLSRNWTYQYQLIKSDDTPVGIEQVGMAPLPFGGVVGGYLLAINAYSAQDEGAWDFLKYATGLPGQRILAREGYIPTRVALIHNQEDVELPTDSILKYDSVKKALMTSIARPVSPSYEAFSETIQMSVHKYLIGINTINKTIYEIDRLVKDYHVLTELSP